MVSTVTVENSVDTGVGTHVDILLVTSFLRVSCNQSTSDVTGEARAGREGEKEKPSEIITP